MTGQGLRVDAVGRYLPPRVVTAAEMSDLLGVTEDWILKRTGVAERRWVTDETPLDMAVAAVNDVVARSEDGLDGVDLIIYASATPHQLIPDTSALLQRELGLGRTGVKSFSVHTTCLSFFSALDIVAAYMAAGTHRRALVVSAEVGSAGIDITEPESGALLGDMATAVLLSANGESGSELRSLVLKTYGDGADLCRMEAGFAKHPMKTETKPEDYMFHMDGPKVFALAYELFPPIVMEALDRAEVSVSDITLVVPHQASLLAVKAIQRALGVTDEQVILNIDKVGNCVAASLPGALFDAVEEKRIERGDTVLLAGTGAGVSMGAAVLTW